MNLYDIKNLSKQETVSQFIAEYKNSNIFLSYLDYNLIDNWLDLAKQDVDLILLILSEALDQYYENPKNKNKSFSLKKIDKHVCSSLNNHSINFA